MVELEFKIQYLPHPVSTPLAPFTFSCSGVPLEKGLKSQLNGIDLRLLIIF